MEKKINIAEILKDCPKGMELDCTIYSNVTFIGINKEVFPTIKVQTEEGVMHLTECGCYAKCETAKCVIFPKGKTTWEGFVLPFKDGDVVATTVGDFIAITRGGERSSFIPTYCVLRKGKFEAYIEEFDNWAFDRLATEAEKQKLFQAIKDNGYKWNAETKTLEKLIEPKFKVGDVIVHCERGGKKFTIDGVYKTQYGVKELDFGIPIETQDEYELDPNKFDITTLKPFDKVLVKDCYDKDAVWECDIFSHVRDNEDFVTVGGVWKYCIPYEMNKELHGTADDCDDYYKTWEF